MESAEEGVDNMISLNSQGNSSGVNKSKQYAIKNIKNVFESDVYAHRVLREIKLLNILKGHTNIVKLKTIMRPSNPKKFNDLNLVLEFCE